MLFGEAHINNRLVFAQGFRAYEGINIISHTAGMG